MTDPSRRSHRSGPVAPTPSAIAATHPLGHDDVHLDPTGWLGEWQRRNAMTTVIYVLGRYIQGTNQPRWPQPQVTHELYTAGHLFQAAVAAARTGTLPGRTTIAERFADLARQQIDRRGHGFLSGFRAGSRSYFLDHRPIRETDTATGHAARPDLCPTAVLVELRHHPATGELFRTDPSIAAADGAVLEASLLPYHRWANREPGAMRVDTAHSGFGDDNVTARLSYPGAILSGDITPDRPSPCLHTQDEERTCQLASPRPRR